MQTKQTPFSTHYYSLNLTGFANVGERSVRPFVDRKRKKK